MPRLTAATAAVVLTSLALAASAHAGAAICPAGAPKLEGKAATARNLRTVQAIYAAFGKGDVPAILGCIAPDAHWEQWRDNHAQKAGVPWLQEQQGPAGVANFFTYIGAWKVNKFAIKNVMAAGANVAAEVDVDFDVTQTGGRIQDEEVHYWTFNAQGQITGLRHYNDTAKHIAASKGGR